MKLDYIQQAYNGLYDSWRYIIGTIIIFIAWQFIGAIPLGIFLIAKVFNGATMATDIPGMVDMLGSNLFLFLMLVSFAVGLVGVILSAKLLHKQSFKSLTTARNKIDWKRFWFIFILWGTISSGLVLLDYYLTPEDYVFNFNAKAFIILAVIGILLLPLQTSFEEYFFRGYLMQGLGVIFKNRWAPLVLTSVGFGMLHIFNPEVDTLGPVIMIFYIGTGFILGIMTLMDEGLELALGFHAANNLFTALLVTADWTALQTDSILKDISDPSRVSFVEIAAPVLVIYPLILFILSKKYGWKNWKEKLFGPVVEPLKDDYKVIE
ncbi:CPBP family intramembrane glutamic endopeptidase [Winogradskyella immobilis]|uniref:CPBP family intramembrane metalloprotease n=1 Tax=Winogradskyella immobilis TaxID=2816852 RepID=A0ABS8EKM0_9FLAO|nr:CPBP family intramembrane glutamic endopeptidase [Winogradskyella immobilis]MCC1483703.1 CPBP family intramembrane metalloprotease [Winogradskyella immobilis]MCG0015797.1 CPBP family intramembrane metalloprotease [Winogradskyella immobilis]